VGRWSTEFPAKVAGACIEGNVCVVFDVVVDAVYGRFDTTTGQRLGCGRLEELHGISRYSESNLPERRRRRVLCLSRLCPEQMAPRARWQRWTRGGGRE
jgi:hypothetical protein